MSLVDPYCKTAEIEMNEKRNTNRVGVNFSIGSTVGYVLSFV